MVQFNPDLPSASNELRLNYSPQLLCYAAPSRGAVALISFDKSLKSPGTNVSIHLHSDYFTRVRHTHAHTHRHTLNKARTATPCPVVNSSNPCLPSQMGTLECNCSFPSSPRSQLLLDCEQPEFFIMLVRQTIGHFGTLMPPR